jgi:hypothetical protein
VLSARGEGSLPVVAHGLHAVLAWLAAEAAVHRDAEAGQAYCPGHVHEDALGIAVPVTVPARDGKPAVVAALSAIVPVTSDGKAVTAVLVAAARGIGRTLRGKGR